MAKRARILFSSGVAVPLLALYMTSVQFYMGRHADAYIAEFIMDMQTDLAKRFVE